MTKLTRKNNWLNDINRIPDEKKYKNALVITKQVVEERQDVPGRDGGIEDIWL